MSPEQPVVVKIAFTPDVGKSIGAVVATFPDGTTETDRVNISRRKARQGFAAMICAERDGIDERDVLQELERLAAATAAENPSGTPAVPTRDQLLAARDTRNEELLAQTDAGVVAEAEAMLADPKLANRILHDIIALGVVGEVDLAMTTYMLGTSRLLPEPLSALVQGLSATGKSFVPDKVSRLFPPEATLRSTDLSPNVLYYLPPGRLMHCFVSAGERRRSEDPEQADAAKALREMISSGGLSKTVTVKSSDGKGMVGREIHQYGPIAYIESTTKAQVFDEDANRRLLLGTDESQEQTARIVHAQAHRAAGHQPDAARIEMVHQCLQRLLRRVEVIVPFAAGLARAIPTRHQNARRALPHIISMVQAVAVLHQRQRKAGEVQHGDVIEATFEDYAIARRLLEAPMGRALGRSYPDAVLHFADRILERYGQEQFTSTQALKDDEVLNTKSKINEYLGTLADAGMTECVEPNKGSKPAVWRIVGEVPRPGATWLPLLDQIQEGAT